jgi:hypothetical protein
LPRKTIENLLRKVLGIGLGDAPPKEVAYQHGMIFTRKFIDAGQASLIGSQRLLLNQRQAQEAPFARITLSPK